MMFKYLDKLAGQWYLDFLCATDYPEQCPEHELAKWYDLVWLLIPVSGFLVFLESIKARRNDNRN